MRRLAGLAVAGAIAVSGIVLAMPEDVAAMGPGDGTLSVRVIRDMNGNGSYEPAMESGVAGIPVTVTDPAGGTASATTGPDGTIVVDLAGVTGGQYRVEASIPESMANLKPAPAGGGLSSLTEFVNVASGANADVTMGVWDPTDYCQANPDLVTCVLAKGDNDTAMGINTFASELGTSSPGGTVNQLSTSGQQRAVFGIGTDRARNVFLGTYVKRHTEYGPAGPVNAIYRLNADVPNAVSVFTTLPGALTAHNPAGSVPYIADDVIYDRVGREGLGDVDVSPDGKTLYAVNLNDSSLYTVPIQGTGNAVTAGTATAVAIPRPGANCEGEWHPFGIGVRGTRVVVGGVCGADNTVSQAVPFGDPSKLRAHIYTFTGSGFTPLFDFALDYPRACAFRTPGMPCQPGAAAPGMVLTGSWEAWNARTPAVSPGGFSDFVSAPQPMVSNIEIDNAGNLVIGMRDRFADMQGNETQAHGTTALVRGIAAGDVLKACVSDAGFALEADARCGGTAGALGGNNQGPGGGEFYDDNWTDGNFHDQTSTGGLVHLPSVDDVWTTRIDPFDNRPFHQGASRLDGDGAVLGRIEVNATDAGTPNFFGKANGLADLEALCDNAPVQLGNRVWFDTDADGTQDGNEPPVAGVQVTLTPCEGGAALPAKTTDARGEYYFGTADGLLPDTCYNTTFDYSGVDTSALPGAPPIARLRWTTQAVGDNPRIDSNVDNAGAAQVTTGPAGSVDHTVDAGLIAAPTNKLGDFVWVDTNRNGVQDSGEPGVQGVTAILRSGDTEVSRTTTDANGKYLFDGLDDGTYQVCFDLTTLPADYAGYLLTKPNAGDDAADSDADPTTGCTATTVLGPDKREDLTLDAGIRPPDRLGDFVWIDTNRDGLQSDGEPGVPDVTVILKNADGTQLGTTTTGADGKYLFDKLPDGTYQVCFDVKALPAAVADYLLTKPNAGDDTKDSDADPATGCTEQVQLTVDNPENLTLDAGLVPPVNRLGDFVWIDTNRDGLQTEGEQGVQGVTVVVKNAEGTQVGTTTTDANGKYLFEGLPDGAYQVCFDTKALPATVADYTLTTQNTGDDAADSDADPATGCTEPVTLGVGSREILTLDAGLVAPPNRLGDLVWVDTNRNGLQDDGEPGVPGVTVVVKKGDGTQVGTTTTDADGKYVFEGLPDGTYQVCFDLKTLPADYAGYLPTKPNAGDDTKDSDADPATGCTESVTLGVGKRENLTLDAGIRPPNRLGDLVWVDTNRDGLQDNGEPGVPGMTVVLRSGNDEVARTTTDPNGSYVFDKLPDGDFVVCFDQGTLPADYTGYLLTKPNAGDDAADSDADPATWCTPPTTLSADHPEDLTLDAGIRLPNRLGDLVWVDTNRNGMQDSGEPGVPGVTVTVKKPDGTVVGTATTDPNGNYVFDKLPDGDFVVCFDRATLPAQYADYQLAVPNAGDDTKDSDADPATWCTPPVTLSADKPEDLTVDAGIVEPRNRVGDYVWLDRNQNGLQDKGEPPAPNVPVVLLDKDNKKIAETTTTKDGKYLFDGLPDGDYRVCFQVNLPPELQGYTLTKPKAGDDALDSDPDPQTGCTRQVKLGPGQREILTLDAGFVAPPAAATGGSWLASTGAVLGWWPLLGLLAIALGVAAMLAARRRTSKD